jgi:hypothetical protein
MESVKDGGENSYFFAFLPLQKPKWLSSDFEKVKVLVVGL